MGFFQRLGVKVRDLEEIIESRPSLRGLVVGYLAETRLVEMWFPHYSVEKVDDRDRAHKGDRLLTYKRKQFRIEVKSLQSNSVKKTTDGWTGKFQVDASDSRPVTLPNGERLKTVCLTVGGFDLLAVNLFDFGNEWRFAFVKNCDLPRSTYRKYTPEQRKHLLLTTPKITWPLQPPFRDGPFSLLNELVSKSH
jgi:hypothetical protein